MDWNGNCIYKIHLFYSKFFFRYYGTVKPEPTMLCKRKMNMLGQTRWCTLCNGQGWDHSTMTILILGWSCNQQLFKKQMFSLDFGHNYECMIITKRICHIMMIKKMTYFVITPDLKVNTSSLGHSWNIDPFVSEVRYFKIALAWAHCIIGFCCFFVFVFCDIW